MKSLIPFNNRRNDALSTGFEDFYNLLDDFFTPKSLERGTFKLDLKATEQEYIVEAELPGVKKEEIGLSLDEGHLTISVNQTESSEEKSGKYLHRERRASSMSRSIYLADATHEGIGAELNDGVLTVSIKKQPKHETNHKIEIK
jgi:HSP20 family protein